MIEQRPDGISERPLPVTVFDDVEGFSAPHGCVYLAARLGEERSAHVRELESRSPGATFIEIVNQSRFEFAVADAESRVLLRSSMGIGEFLGSLATSGPLYVDITGLTHAVWAGLICTALRLGKSVKAVYVEPFRYKENALADPSRDLFDLTAKFEGIAPLPGLTRIAPPRGAPSWFVPLLGFEGKRFSYMREQVAPLEGRTVPIIGVPGFQPEFVSFAYHGNQEPLLQDDAWQRVAFATANCPFSLFNLLVDLSARVAGEFLQIATIGTKPHSLGAVLYAYARPDRAEIFYDYPERKNERTSGRARLLLYHLDEFGPLRLAA